MADNNPSESFQNAEFVEVAKPNLTVTPNPESSTSTARAAIEEAEKDWPDDVKSILGDETLSRGEIIMGLHLTYPLKAEQLAAVMRSRRQEIRALFTPGFLEKKKALKERITALEGIFHPTDDDEEDLQRAYREFTELTGGYADIKKIGKGGYGTVYKAIDSVSGDAVVLKIVNEVSPESFDRLVRESKVLIGLGEQHQGILKGYLLKKLGREGIPGIHASDGKMLIETELVEGDSGKKIGDEYHEGRAEILKILELKSHPTGEDFTRILSSKLFQFSFTSVDNTLLELEKLAPAPMRMFKSLAPDAPLNNQLVKRLLKAIDQLKDRVIASFLAQACSGISLAHQQGVIHRDIKPENLMMDPEGNAKVIDWGLVRSFEQASAEKRVFERSDKLRRPEKTAGDFDKELTSPHDVLGTPYYSAPEMIVQNPLISPAADVWSMGVTLAVMLTGLHPFEGKTVLDVMSKIVNYNRNDLDKVLKAISDLRLRAIVAKALARHPKDRFSSMEEFQHALESANHRRA